MFSFVAPLLQADATKAATPKEMLLLWPEHPELNAPAGKGKQVVEREKAFLVDVKSDHPDHLGTQSLHWLTIPGVQ